MNRMVDLISAVKRETALPDDRFLGVGIAIPSLVSPDGETTVYGMSWILFLVISFFSRIPSCLTLGCAL